MKHLSRILPPVSALLCAACLILLLADLILPDLSLFLMEPVKLLILLTGLLASVTGGMLIARERHRSPRR